MVARAARLLLLLALVGCGSLGGVSSPTGGVSTLPGAGMLPDRVHQSIVLGNYIKHVVIIVQENRSFNSFFDGYPGALTQNYGYTHTGTRVNLTTVALADTLTFNHDYSEAWAAYDNGQMNGFDENTYENGAPVGTAPYTKIRQSDVAPYWTYAEHYVLADHMFPTMLSASYTAHLDLIAGTTDLNPQLAVVDVPTSGPWGCWAPHGTTTPTINSLRQVHSGGPFPCYTQFKTMATTLDNAGVSWKYYAPPVGDNGRGLWTEFAAISYVFNGPDWNRNIITPETQVLTDASHGNLASVSWVIPDWANSDHSWNGSNTGPSWVTSVVNAIAEGPDWHTTAIFVVWDDWGGFFDPAVPPQLDFRGLGIRVPCIIISPYAKVGYVDHTQYEYGSILKFIEEAFNLPALGTTIQGYTDTRATAPLNAFNFNAPARQYEPVKAKYSASYFFHRKPSYKIVDTE